MADGITVRTPDGGSYPILIRAGGLNNVAAELGLDGETSRRVVVVTNTTVAPLYGDGLVKALPNAALVTIPDGEQYKTLDTVAGLYRDFIAAGLDRAGIVIALGGGVLGDIAGFAAATYMRGVGLVQIPTTLLSMVDSSVGGKVGVDLSEGKNLVGAFKQPDKVLIDRDVLATLPEREWRCGMAEVIKHGFLADEGLLDPALHTKDRAEELIQRAVRVKVDVVEKDPFERDIRAHLNLGHTFGHAIEQVTNYEIPHGEAVSIGLVAVARLSHVLSLCDAALPERMESILDGIGLPVSVGGLDSDAIYATMATDKKWQGGRSRFVLLRGVGEPLIMEGVAKADVIGVLERLGERSRV